MIQYLYNLAISRTGFAARIYRRLFRYATKRLNILVSYSIGGIPIQIPISHDLPFLALSSPEYSKSVGRVAAISAGKYPDAVLIDVGANVGDSAALIRSHAVNNPIVCVEGLPNFFEILQLNSIVLDVIAVKSFVGPCARSVTLRYADNRGGNARVFEVSAARTTKGRATDLAGTYEFSSIEGIVEKAMPGRKVKLIKTDIEGYDLPALNASLNFIGKHKPIIYMELQVSDVDEDIKGTSWRELWSNLAALGYAKAFYWYNSTDFVCMLDINTDLRVTEDLHNYFRNRAGKLYADVCIVHESDKDLADLIYATERANMAERHPAKANYETHQ